MNGQDLETVETTTPFVGQTSYERRTEAILRRAASWETETPEPVGLAYRALTKKGVLRDSDRRRPFTVRHWWGAGTLGVASALTLLVYAHPVSFDTMPTDAPTSTPLTQKAASAPSDSAKAEKVVPSFVPDATATKKNEATNNVAQQDTRPTRSAAAKHPRSVVRRGGGRRVPETTYRPHTRTHLAHRRRSDRSYKTTPPAAPQPTNKETTTAPQFATNPAPLDATPTPTEERALVPIVLTQESEDGSEIIATPALVELAYNL